jgi:hypothetical protein
MTAAERTFFLENGYLHARNVLDPGLLERIRDEFEQIWATEGRANQLVLLKHRTFIDLIEHPPILARQAAIFGRQTQLLQYDFLRQGPGSTAPLRSWHRDLSFPGDRPLSINTIVYLDRMDDASGPTYVVPGSHRGSQSPTEAKKDQMLPDEVPVYAEPGDAVFVNGALWHSGSRNQSKGLRRGIYMYYGHWWMKRYEAGFTLPAKCLEGASQARLRLLGFSMPDRDLHMYDPARSFSNGGEGGT